MASQQVVPMVPVLSLLLVHEHGKYKTTAVMNIETAPKKDRKPVLEDKNKRNS